ncbi:uncharacterized protein [Epargyreus clarus]|uniref:uncharacterized protein n=1 Tax=Epargyreus clarus TaxID=520877 RepID=UPI003C30C5A0
MRYKQLFPKCVIHYFRYITGLLICMQLVLSKKPYGKREREVWRLECELGVITDLDCPIDGGWSSWTAWSSCQGGCDGVGHRRRTRDCTNPVTSRDGIPCVGPDEQIEACFILNCSVHDFYKLVEGDVPRIEALHQLEAVPALLERCLQMECPYEAVEAALSSDNTWQLNSEALWNSLQCVKYNLGCPIRGEWGVWGTWSACGARCGNGLRWRLRRCDTPPPSDATLICTGTPLQSEQCEGDQCAIEERYTEYSARGAWSTWGQWSVCSENCGSGVRRRKRTCLESHIPFATVTWGTHCRGQHDQLEICINSRCSMDGGWSGWGPWGPCSQTCGAGRRSRTRSCTRPIPSGEGKNCEGPREETGSCYLDPCEVYTYIHLVAILNGDSYLQYNLSGKRSTLFHFYIRFKPLSPSGSLVRRGSLQSPYVRLSLQKWHVCLDASGMSQTCALSRICSTVGIEPAVWHTALIAISSQSATIRLDNALTSIKSSFPCDPELENSPVNVYIGERFNGEIQDLILNFNPLKMTVERDSRRKKRSDYFPTFSSNVAYEKANIDEAILILDNDHYIRLPCFNSQDEWQLEVTLKPKGDSGIILFLCDDTIDNWFYMALENMRLKMKLAIGDFRSESSSTTDYPINQWLDISLSKKAGTNTIESIINAAEKLHILVNESTLQKRRKAQILINRLMTRKNRNVKSSSVSICNDEFFLGIIPPNVKHKVLEEFSPLSGVIASLRINGVLLDLHNCSLERYKDNSIHLSSRTASVSCSYHEAAWGISNNLNLTCLHARVAQKHNSAHWLFLDTTVNEVFSDKNIKIVEDGRILRLTTTTDNDLKGFYTCRAHSNKYTYNVVTYGVIGQVKYNLNSPDMTTIIAVFTTVTLVVCTLSWLVIEGIHDLRTGYGFFRDAHFTPQEEAEAICKYIDQNAHLYSSKSALKLAKARARRKGRRLASRMSFGAQEPQGLIQMQSEIPEDSKESSALETLPALPEIKSSRIETSHDVYRCEPSYISSPRHGSIQSPESKLTSSSTNDLSPRVICSRLLITKYKHASTENLRSKKDKTTRSVGVSYNVKPKLPTIKSSTYMNLSPAQKVLQKFHELKSDDL